MVILMRRFCKAFSKLILIAKHLDLKKNTDMYKNSKLNKINDNISKLYENM